MSTQIEWLSDDKVMEVRVPEQIGIAESGNMNKDINFFFHSSRQRRVHILFDITKMAPTQMNLTLLTTILLPLSMDPACGWLVLYGTEKRVNDLFGVTMTAAFRRRFRTSPDRDQALAILRENVPGLVLEDYL